MNLNRSSFYKWKKSKDNPSEKALSKAKTILFFTKYHNLYPSHGYRWLNAYIKLKEGIQLSNLTAHRYCKELGIVAKTRHYHYRRPGDRSRVYDNLLIAGLKIDGPYQFIVSDMTCFWSNNVYYELTLYMDLWNNEILAYGISSKRGDNKSYYDGLSRLLEIKKEYPELEMILHSDQGSVYSSKNFNEVLPNYNIKRSMSRAGTPTDNATMEAINGWIKDELFTDMHITGERPIEEEIADYIKFFNEERPAYSLKYLTPKQYKEAFYKK